MSWSTKRKPFVFMNIVVFAFFSYLDLACCISQQLALWNVLWSDSSHNARSVSYSRAKCFILTGPSTNALHHFPVNRWICSGMNSSLTTARMFFHLFHINFRISSLGFASQIFLGSRAKDLKYIYLSKFVSALETSDPLISDISISPSAQGVHGDVCRLAIRWNLTRWGQNFSRHALRVVCNTAWFNTLVINLSLIRQQNVIISARMHWNVNRS